MSESTDKPGGADAIRLSSEDNVATVLRAVKAGEQLLVRDGVSNITISVREAIPLCHKVSLVALAVGDRIVKYGEAIGVASTVIQAGRHVHVHNLRSLRGRAVGY